MTKTNHYYRFASLSLAILFVASSVGCQSSGGSKWAWWKPWSGASEDATLVARTAPALPSDSATPVLEGARAPATAVAAANPTKVPTIQAAIPTITTESVAPTFNSSPNAEAAKIASTPQLASQPTSPAMQSPSYPMAAIPQMKTPATPTASSQIASAAGGPYDPNGYKDSTPAKVASSAASSMDDRYGNLGNRYASAAATANPEFNYQAEATQAVQAASSVVGDRYNSYAAAPTDNYQPTSAEPVAKAESLPSPPSSTGDRYAATPSYSAEPSYSAAPSYAATPSYQATPSTATNEVASPRYPVTPSEADNPSMGAVVASNNTSLGSEVRLVSSPGEYRPGGTSTYPSTMNIATKPDAPGSSVATPAYPSSGSRYQ